MLKTENVARLTRIAAILRTGDPLHKYMADDIEVILKEEDPKYSLIPTKDEMELAKTQRINAIKEYRSRTGSSLKDAKDAIDAAVPFEPQ